MVATPACPVGRLRSTASFYGAFYLLIYNPIALLFTSTGRYNFAGCIAKQKVQECDATAAQYITCSRVQKNSPGCKLYCCGTAQLHRQDDSGNFLQTFLVQVFLCHFALKQGAWFAVKLYKIIFGNLPFIRQVKLIFTTGF